MKKICIKTIEKADKSSIRTKLKTHHVFLHSGVTRYFSDIKQAKAFLVRTNDFLDTKMFELNEIYIELFSNYRRMWFYMDIPSETIIRRSINEIENFYKLMVERSSWNNGGPMVFRWMELIINNLTTMSQIINEINYHRGNWAELRIIETIKTRIQIIDTEIQSWPDIKNIPGNHSRDETKPK